MNKLIALLAGVVLTTSAFAFSGGSADEVITSTVTAVSFPGIADTVYVYNSGDSTVYCSFGGHVDPDAISESTPITSGGSLTLQNPQISYMSFACVTGETTVIDYGFIGN